MTTQDDMSGLIADVREQVLYLHELGVDGLSVELRAAGAEAEVPVPEATGRKTPVSDFRSGLSNSKAARQVETPKPERPPSGSRLASLPKLGVPSVQRVPSVAGGIPMEASPALPEPTETVEQIRADIGPACTRCPLHSMGRSQVVNSVGNLNAELMFVGEAPGADEDRLGEPFVGRAGQLLTDIIEKGLGIKRADVFIGNINRCRPPGNRTPLPDEAAVCKPFLLREIAVVRPKVIVVLGAHAAQTLLETKTPISKMRGHFHDLLGVKVMPTFHPAYLLRDPHKKREVWEDIKMVRDYLKTGAASQN